MSGARTWPRTAPGWLTSCTRCCLVNQLHALLRELIPGGPDTDLTADRGARALATVRPVGPAETARKQIGRDLVAEIRELDARLAKLSTQMTQALAEHGSRLPDVDGIGPIVACRCREPCHGI
jgi:transposase